MVRPERRRHLAALSHEHPLQPEPSRPSVPAQSQARRPENAGSWPASAKAPWTSSARFLRSACQIYTPGQPKRLVRPRTCSTFLAGRDASVGQGCRSARRIARTARCWSTAPSPKRARTRRFWPPSLRLSWNGWPVWLGLERVLVGERGEVAAPLLGRTISPWTTSARSRPRTTSSGAPTPQPPPPCAADYPTVCGVRGRGG